MRSALEIFDLGSGERRTVFATDRLIEAPNWSPDGGVPGGQRRRAALPAGARRRDGARAIDTGFADPCNNDHGISPDGRPLAISDASETGARASTRCPVGGGAPRQVTAKTPSYWHGWSPDGGTLAYCAERAGRTTSTPSRPGAARRRRLTDGKGASDGPDYTPDGRWIWFNSSRSGHMQLWRMRPDGSGLERMTDDARRTGSRIRRPTAPACSTSPMRRRRGPSVRPRGRAAADACGGRRGRTLLPLFGGQGSINVPCWAPDGRRFAFVRYARPTEGVCGR